MMGMMRVLMVSLGICMTLLVSSTAEMMSKEGVVGAANLRSSTVFRRRLGEDPTVCYAQKQDKGDFENECGFPFTYKGVTYNKCTTVENNGNPWCFHTNGKDWGHCENSNPCKGRPPEPTPSPTPRQPTPEPTRNPTRPPTRNPTRKPTPGPTPEQPTMAPTGAPTITAEPSLSVSPTTTSAPSLSPTTGAPSPAPTDPEVTGNNLLSLQMTPLVLTLIVQQAERRLQEVTETATPGTSRSDALFDLVYDYLLQDYKSSLTQPVAALQLLILGQGDDQVNETTLVLSEQVLGSVYFYDDAPPLQELDAATQAALQTEGFLEAVQSSSDPVLANTQQVQVKPDDTSNPLNTPDGLDNGESGSGDSGDEILGLGTTALIAICITVVCGLLAMVVLGVLIFRIRKQQRISKLEEQSGEGPKSDTPKTSDGSEGKQFFENKMVEVKGNEVSDLESVQSTYSYIQDDQSSFVGEASYVFGIPEPSLASSTPERKDQSPRRAKSKNLLESDGSKSPLSADRIESELDDILNARGESNAFKGGENAIDPLDKVVFAEETAPAQRQMTLSERRTTRDTRDWTEKYGIAPLEDVIKHDASPVDSP